MYQELFITPQATTTSAASSSSTVPSKVSVSPVLAALRTSTAPAKPKCQRQNNFVFIKIHKSGSTTMIAPFQKYAYLYNLTMVVPSLNNNIHLSWPCKFIPYMSHMAPPRDQPFQALVNHVIYNKETFQSLMHPSTKYLTIVREPIPHLISAYQYFSVSANNTFLRRGPKEFEQFLLNPVEHDPKPYWMNRIPCSRLKSPTRNLQSFDLGLHHSDFDNQSAVQTFVEQIRQDFDILLVLERLSESLVLMKRRFCWSMQDILHVNKNVQKTAWGWNIQNISQELIPHVYQWNNADTLLYRMANEKLNELKIGEENLADEIKVYEETNAKVSQYCKKVTSAHAKNSTLLQPLIIDKTQFNERFVVDVKFCTLLLIREEDFTLLHKCRQYPSYKQCKDNAKWLNDFGQLIHGRNLIDT